MIATSRPKVPEDESGNHDDDDDEDDDVDGDQCCSKEAEVRDDQR